MDQMFSFQLSLVLTTRAARDVLSLAKDGEAGGGEAGSEAEARERGAQALAALLPPRQAFTVYLRNGGQGNDAGEQVIELRVATDAGAAPNAALTERLGGKTLALVGTEKSDRYSGDGQFVCYRPRRTGVAHGAAATPGSGWAFSDHRRVRAMRTTP